MDVRSWGAEVVQPYTPIMWGNVITWCDAFKSVIKNVLNRIALMDLNRGTKEMFRPSHHITLYYIRAKLLFSLNQSSCNSNTDSWIATNHFILLPALQITDVPSRHTSGQYRVQVRGRYSTSNTRSLYSSSHAIRVSIWKALYFLAYSFSAWKYEGAGKVKK